LAHREIRFSSPAWFNDPFDCKLPPAITATETEKRRWLEESYVPTAYPSLSGSEHAKAVEQLALGVDDLAEQHMQYTERELIPKSGVLSLSAIPDDILMWSHYADSHRSVCLKFRRSKLKFLQAFKENYPSPYQGKDATYSYEYDPQQVDYSAMVPRVSLFCRPQEAWSACVLTKSRHWRYEREWRVIVPPTVDATGHGWRKLPGQSLMGAIFGGEIKPEDEAQVRQWIRMGGAQVPLFRAVKKPGRFELEIREIT
jgi:hypothetical protein